MPDFDIDFCQDRRDEVIRHVEEKYGRDRVAQIITFGKLQARAVLRDVGRVLEMPYSQVDRICKLVPNNPAHPVTLDQAIAAEPLLREMLDNDSQVARLVDYARRLEGLYRHASTHAAGVVIGDRPLDELIPLYRDPRSDMPVTGFNMKSIEQAGIGEVRFSGPEDSDGARRRGAAVGRTGRRRRSRRTAPRRPRHLRDDRTWRYHRHVPVGERRYAGRASQAEARRLRGHRRRGGALPAGTDGQHPQLHQAQSTARRLPITCIPPWKESSGRPSAS